MEIEPTRYIANEIQPNPPILKEINQLKKKEVLAMGEKMNAIIIDYGSETIKAGFDWSSDGPDLIFRPQVSKNK